MADTAVSIALKMQDQASAPMKRAMNHIDRSASTARRSTTKLSDSFQQATRNVQRLNTALLGLGVGASIYKSLSAFAALDKGLIGIQKTTNMTDLQMQAMGASIRQLALDVPVATQGLLEIAEAAGQLGVTGVRDVTLFTETLAKMEIASDVIGAEGAKSLARLLNVAGEASSEVKTLGSVIVALGNQMAASEAEIVHMASEIGRGTAAFNVSSSAAVAYGAALKAMGARAEISGSAVTRSMIEIEKAIISGGEKFTYLQEVTGMTGETIKQVFQEDSAKVFNAFIRGAHDMTKSGESAITILENFGLKGTEVIKGLTPLIKNVEQLEKAFKIANKEVKNATALDEEAIRASQSFASQMRMTLNAVDEIAAGIGKGLAPAIIDVTQDFRDWVEQNQEFINQDLPDELKRIGEQVKGVADSLASMVGFFASLPPDVVGATGAGIVVRIISGSTPLAATTTGLMLLNEQLKAIDMNLGAIPRKSGELSESFGNVWDVLTGKKHWNTGESIDWDGVFFDSTDFYITPDQTKDIVASVQPVAEAIASEIRSGVQEGIATVPDEISAIVKKTVKVLDKLDPKLAASYDRLKDFLAIHSQADEAARKIAKLNIEYNRMAELLTDMQLAGYDVIEMSEQLEQWYANSMEDITKKTEETTDTIYDTWSHMYERLQDITADWIYDMKVDFDSIVDLFKRTVAEMISAWIWGQQSMQFATSGQGGFSLGNMFGGMFGGGGVYGSGDPRSSSFVGPLQQGVQGAQSAYSLYGAYGAYQGAGGGWSGLQAGAGSFFGGGTAGSGMGATLSAIPWTWWAAAIVIAADYFAKLNVKKEYGLVEGTPQGYGSPYQPTNAFGLDFATDPFGTWLTGTLGFDEPMAGNYLDAAIARSDWGTALKALPATILEWSSPFLTLLGKWAGIDLGKIFGFSNKKRSYLGETYGFGDYSPEEGWGVSDWSHKWKDKRKGEKAFGEAGEGMVETAQGLMNALDSMFKNLLGTFDETKVNAFTTAMAELSAQMVPVTEATRGYQQLLEQGITEVPRMSFGYYISAEDEDEFKDDWRKSWKRATANIIDPIVEIGSDLLNQALDGAVTDTAAWNYFSDEMREYLRAGLTEGLEGLNVDWSVVTDQESFEAALEQMGLAAEQIANVVGYFETVGAILDDITSAIDMREFSSNANAAIAGFRAINAEFEQYALTLESMGVDLEKYTDLEKAHLMALQDEAKAMSDAAMSGKDLALALKYMSEEMTEVGHTVEEIAAAMDAANSGILDSIDDIKKRYEDYGKTALDLMYEKYPEWQGMAYEQWAAGTDLTDWSTEMLQEWRNLGDLLEAQWEEQQAQWEEQQALLDNSLADIVDEITKANQTELKELERLIDSFIKASDAIVDYQESLLASSPGMLSPDVQYAQASQQLDSTIQDLYSKDRETALAASQAIPGYVAQFLDASKAVSATPEQYMADFARAMAVLNTANAINLDWQKNLQSSISSQNSSSYAALVAAYLNRSPIVHLYTGPSMWDTLFGPVYGLRFDPNYGPQNRMLYDPTFNPIGGGGYNDYWGLATGGLVSGPESGFNAPITFHGTEHVIPGDQMKEVQEILGEVKEVLIQVRDTSGDQNKVNKKLYRIIDRVSQGEEYLMTKAV